MSSFFFFISRAGCCFQSYTAADPTNLNLHNPQADEFCKTEKLQIVGYYQANELSTDMDLGPFGRKIAEKIKGQFARAVVLMVDGSKTSVSESDLCLQLLGTDGKPSNQPLTLRDASKAIAFLEQSLNRGAQQQVVDFDAHLDDPSKDWLNSGVVCA
uniref:MPN domain-containing protein n=1 Tax=Chrysotila carterae TaxID=13221 RepID=A0A7S4B2E8_CHRCT